MRNSHYARLLTLEPMVFRNRQQCTPETALCLVLHRSSSSCYKDNMMIFQRSRTWQSIIFCDVVEHLVAHYKDMLFWKGSLLSLPQIALYERAIDNFGSIQAFGPLSTERYQEYVDRVKVNISSTQGTKKATQAVVAPDGIIRLVRRYTGISSQARFPTMQQRSKPLHQGGRTE